MSAQRTYTLLVSGLHFEWDDAKAAANRRKHRIGFEEARSVFLDEDALLLPDPEHSASEERFVLLGYSEDARVLVVCHCYRATGEIIRIISARKANRHEQAQYFERRTR